MRVDLKSGYRSRCQGREEAQEKARTCAYARALLENRIATGVVERDSKHLIVSAPRIIDPCVGGEEVRELTSD